MFTYKNFVWGRQDEHNVNLYQIQNKEVIEGGGRGKGPGVKTGRFEDKEVFIGHYSSISGVLYKILEMDLEATEVKNFQKVLNEHRKYVDSLFSKIKIPVEESEETVKEEV